MVASFFDYYDATRRIEVGPPGGGFFVEMFEHASYASMEGAVRAMAQVQITGNGQPGMRGDLPRYQVLAVLAHVARWNITDPDGREMQVSEANIKRLPLVVFNQLWQEVEKLDEAPSKEEQKRFPDEDGGGDQARDTGAGLVPEVPDGAGGLQTAGADLGAVPEQAVA